MNTPTLDGYLTATQLAHRLGLSRRTVYYWLEKGAVHAIRIGGLQLIPPDEVAACLAHRSNSTGTASHSPC